MESLWPSFEKKDIERNDSIQILREQAKFIKTDTQGLVCATFSKMNYKASPAGTLKAIGQVVSALSSPMFEEELEEELVEKKDANDLYKITPYKFELYNSEYRFRLFVLKYRELFPISLDIDEGILEDTQYKNGSPIYSNDDLKNIIREIFSSHKVNSVVMKMLQNGKSTT